MTGDGPHLRYRARQAARHEKCRPRSAGSGGFQRSQERPGDVSFWPHSVLVGHFEVGRVGMWRGGSRFGLSVAAPFVWRCPSTLAVAPFPHPSHRTGRADFPHPALGQDFTPSPTARHAPSARGGRDPWSRRDTREDSPHTRDAAPCACCATTGSAAPSYSCRLPDTPC